MIIEFDSNLKLEIPNDICKELLKFKQQSNMNESGGILLGKKNLESYTYTLTTISTPSPTDKSTLTSFIRKKKNAQKILDHEWNKSNGIVNYLGEWHTHSVMHPSPSLQDKLFIKQLHKDKINQFRHFFMFILGNTGLLFIGVVDSNITNSFVYKKTIQIEED